MNLLLQLMANGIVNGALFAVLALGFGLVWRSLRIFHAVYGGLFVTCAYCFQTLINRGGLHPTTAFFLTLFFAGCMGWLLELTLYRPFYRKQVTAGSVLVASLGIFIAFENCIAIVFGDQLQTITRQISYPFCIGPVMLTEFQLWQFSICGAILCLFWLLISRLRIFKALWAMGDLPELIPVLGLPVYMLRSLSLILSTMLVSIPACLICLDTGIDPHMGMSYLLIAAVSVLVGGLNSFKGWLCGAVVLAVLQSLVVWKFSARWMDLATFSMLIAMLVIRPKGLLEYNQRVEETL